MDYPMQTRLMIVDDDCLALDCLAAMLCRHFPAASIETFNDPRQALLAIQQASFNVVLTDLNMPGMSGIHLLRAAREAGSDASFIVMTGDSADDILTEGLRLGMFALLHKPLNRTALIPAVQQAMECYRLRKEVAELRRTLVESGNSLGEWMHSVAVALDVDTQPVLPF
jgi:DNA-binding NtrC family response regulator